VAIRTNHTLNSLVSTNSDLKLSVDQKSLHDIDADTNRIKNVADPLEAGDVVTKRYLETQVSSSIQDSTFLYSNTNPMPEEVGGYEIGDTFTDATLEQLFTNLLYPYQYPAVSSFQISGQTTTLEVGEEIPSGNKNFAWNFTNSTNIATNSVSVRDVTANTVLVSGLSNDGDEVIDIGGVIKKTSAQTHTWSVSAQNTKGQNISRNFNVNWRWRTYHGTSAQETLTETEVKQLVSNSLDSNYTGNKSVAAGGFKYFAYPTVFGLRSTFKDTISGFAVAMNPAITISITNDFGVTQDYYLHRTTNPIVGSLVVAVS
jgi:hypothetical protein